MTADSELRQTVTQEPSPAGTGNLTLHSEATFTPDEGSESEARLKDSAQNEVKDSENKKDAGPDAAQVAQDAPAGDANPGIPQNGTKHSSSTAGPAKSDGKEVESKPPAKPANFMTLVHHRGEEIMVPWTLCKTWKGMDEFIRSLYEEDEEGKDEVDKGAYKLRTDSGVVFPRFWEMLAEPAWTVTITLNSHDDDSDSSSDESSDGEQETVYVPKAKYTVEYFMQDQFSRHIEDGRFLHKTSSDDPVILARSTDKAGELYVLEEIQPVTIPYRYDFEDDEFMSKHGTELGINDTVGKTKLRIHSPFLLNVLRSVIRYSSKKPSGDGSDELGEGVFQHPYADLFYHIEELSKYKTETTGPRANHTAEYNAECDQHIDLLLDYLGKEPKVQLPSFDANRRKKAPMTTFGDVWLLMKPGSDVYVREHGTLNAYVVDSVFGGTEYTWRTRRPDQARPYVIRLWNLTFDGEVIRRVSKTICVSVFDNEREIMSLPVFPTRFHDEVDGGERRRQLIERGKKAARYATGPSFLEYTGKGLKPGGKKYSRARVVVEHESRQWDQHVYTGVHPLNDPMSDTVSDILTSDEVDEIGEDVGKRSRVPRCECQSCMNVDPAGTTYISTAFSDYDGIDPRRPEGLSDHQYLLCMSHMFGFILKDRAYDLLDVDGLVEPRIVENAIDRLVMRPEENKNMIKAIVKTHTDSCQAETFKADFIYGKGEGQIFLLHGPPGTGKTLTAESVAEYTRRPLLSITAADLGHEPASLEQNLLQFFKDATAWDAIVLLDEADVYLERRSANDLRRNSIVSIFLRAMDYFEGILFLTTNRVGHFDEAFMSRIHVSIGYERLDDKAREQIWDNLFAKLKEDKRNGGPEVRYEYEAKQYVKKDEDVKKLEWNGREIRNAFQTAVSLATFDARVTKEKGGSDEDVVPEIKESHISQVVRMSAAFKEYVTATHEGIEDVDLAYKQGIRHDRPRNGAVA